MGLNFLGRLFEQKAADPAGAVARSTAQQIGTNLTTLGLSDWGIDKAIRDGYEKVIWVFRCVDTIATNASRLKAIVREDDPVDGPIVEELRTNLLLNRRANGYETAQQFRYRLSSQLQLSRKGAFIEIVPANDGRPGGLNLLPPGITTPIPDPISFVSGFKVELPNKEASYVLDPDQVIWIRLKPHPTDPYAQMTPLVAAGLAVDTDWMARLFNRNFIANNGKPSQIIRVSGQLSQEDALELKRRFSGGPQRAGEVSVIQADDMDISDLSGSPADINWLGAINGSKEDILLAHGVPESVMGNASGRTFDNADAEREGFWMDTMLSHCDPLGAALDPIATSSGNPDLFVTWNYDAIDVLQRQKRARHDKLLADMQAGTITINDYLEGIGREPIDVPGARVLWFPGSGMVPIATNVEDQQAAEALVPLGPVPVGGPVGQQGNFAPAGKAISLDDEQTHRSGDEYPSLASLRTEWISAYAKGVEAGRQEAKALVSSEVAEPNIIEAEVIPEPAYVHPYNETRIEMESKIDSILFSWSARQEQIVLDRLDHAKVRKNTRHWDGPDVGTKALDPSYVVQMDQWVQEVQDQIGAVLRPIAEKEARRSARDMQSEGILERMNIRGKGNPDSSSIVEKVNSNGYAALVDPTMNSVLDMVRTSAQRQSERVAAKITEMDTAGSSLTDIKAAVRQMIGTRSSWRKGLAIHATTALVEGVKAATYGEAGEFIGRQWKSHHDERVRATHLKADNQVAATGTPFNVGGYSLMYPGDPAGPIGEVANCRCHVQYTVSERGSMTAR